MSTMQGGMETFANTMSDTGGAPGGFAQPKRVLDNTERIRRFGIECSGPVGDGVCFRGGEWEVGGEYVQKLTVKNVSTRMRKLKYKLPDTPYFSMVFPERIDLPPGMHIEIDVVFRPVEYQVYDDTIYFKICEGDDSRGFHVPCRALISTLQASVPDSLDFGLCSTNETMKYVFQIVNDGEIPAPFDWTCPAPFSLTPMSGVVPVGGAVPVEVSIRPTDASVFVSLATCEVGRGVQAIKPRPILELRLSAVGRYAHIEPSQERVDFGTLLVGAKEGTTKEIEIRNRSTVPATVRITRQEDDREAVFTLEPPEFVIPPQSFTKVLVRFAPVCAGAYTMEHFEFTTPGGNRTKVTCSGLAEAPKVTLYKTMDPNAGGYGESDSLNFRDVVVGHTNSTALFLRNDSGLPVRFAVVAEGSGVFAFDRTTGTIPAELEVNIKVTFTPDFPMNYYQRVFVLIENAMPLFVDLLGTGFIRPRGDVKEQRPFPMRHSHVQAWRNRCAAGLGKFSPAMLDEVVARDGMSDLFAFKGQVGTRLLEATAVSKPMTRSGDSTRDLVAVATEFFLDPNAGARGETTGGAAQQPVFLSSGVVDFGYASQAGAGERRTVVLTNASHGKVAVQWILPEGAGEERVFGGGGGIGPVFDVVPRVADIGAGRSAEFKFVFRPQLANTYFCQEVECYASFKTQRTFRLVKDETMQPPWCLKLKGLGHTLGGEQFAAQVRLSSFHGVVEFPSAHVGDATYHTIRLDNSSNLPATYTFDEDDSGVFAVKPRAGLIAPGSFVLALARFFPTGPRKFRHELRCIVNNEPEQARTVTLKGEATFPQIRVAEVDDLRRAMGLSMDTPAPPLHIKSTCTGLVSSRTLTVTNPKRIPVVYSVEIPARLSGVFEVTPRMGLLRGGQSATLTVSFAPREQKEYKLHVTIKVRAVSGPPLAHLGGDSRMIGDAAEAEVVSETHVTLIAPGSGAVVTFEPAQLDFGCLLVNNTADSELTLVNESDCDVQYELHHIIAPEKKDKVKIRAGSSLVSTVGDNDSLDPEVSDQLQPVPRAGRPYKTPPLLVVDRPKGILPAHSRTLVKVTFQPLRAGSFDVGLAALVSAVDPATGAKVALGAEDSARVRVGDRAALVALLKGIPEDSPDFDEDAALPLSVSIVGKASFPTIIITDVRCLGGGLGGSTRQLWKTMGLEPLNYALAQPLTRKEVKANLSSSADKDSLPCYPVRFTPSPLGSAPCVLVLRLTNPGILTTSFEVHFPNEREVEVPKWADEGEPNEAQLMENRIIDELKSFEVFPRQGVLASGESVALTLSYKYDSLDYGGRHELGIHCKINQGKQFRFLLQGETLAPGSCRLWQSVPPSDSTHRLMPVALGTTLALAPVQTTELMNTGDSDLQYAIDCAPLMPSVIGAEAYGFRNMFLENPTGVIPARSTHYLKWRFLPLEAREYLYALPLTYRRQGEALSGEKSLTMVVSGLGFDPRAEDPHADAMPHVDTGLVPPPHQLLDAGMGPRLALLNRERLNLGRLPQRAKRHELVVLRNPSPDMAVDFVWEGAHPLVTSGLVTLSPLKGKLPPGGFAVVKVTVSADCAPCIVENQLSVYLTAASAAEVTSKRNRSRGGATAGGSRGGTATGTPGGLALPISASASTLVPTNSGGSAFPGQNTIVSRSTAARDSMLRGSTPHVSKLTGRDPQLPSRPPPPPKTGNDGPAAGSSPVAGGAAASAAASSTMGVTRPSSSGTTTGRGALSLPPVAEAGSYLHVCLWFEVVDEESFVGQFASDVAAVNVPRPRAFIPPYAPPSPLLSPRGDEGKGDEGSALKLASADGVVKHVKSTLSPTELSISVIGGLFGEMLSELLGGSEVVGAMLALPKQPPIKVYHDLRERANFMKRLEMAFKSFDLDGSGKLSTKEIKAAIVTMGLKATTASAKAWMRSLDEDSDGEVDLKEFLNSTMPPEILLALEEAMEAMEYDEKLRNAEGRRIARMFAPTLKGQGITADRAALCIQGKFRTRQARKRMRLKKELAESADAREMHAAANKLQGQMRGKAARAAARERAAAKTAMMRQRTLGDPQFQNLIAELTEGTVLNLLSEALNGEFDLGTPPQQFTFAPQGLLGDDDDESVGSKSGR